MVKKEFKTIVAIETAINGHTEYISGQSTTFYNKNIPQYHKDPVHAKEFVDEEDANTYLQNVHNPFHRHYAVIAIEIPVIKDLKKYDREKSKDARRLATPVLRTKPITDALISLLIVLVFTFITSCSKSQVAQPKLSTANYQCIIDRYSLDTATLILRTIWWQDNLSNPKERIKIDTLSDQWFRVCTSNNVPTHIDHTYYMRDGKKINASKFPIKK